MPISDDAVSVTGFYQKWWGGLHTQQSGIAVEPSNTHVTATGHRAPRNRVKERSIYVVFWLLPPLLLLLPSYVCSQTKRYKIGPREEFPRKSGPAIFRNFRFFRSNFATITFGLSQTLTRPKNTERIWPFFVRPCFRSTCFVRGNPEIPSFAEQFPNWFGTYIGRLFTFVG